jgi:hypothetical protein
MPTPCGTSRRRSAQRRTRLVNLASVRFNDTTIEVLRIWELGLMLTRQLQTYFPEFYEQHAIGQRQATPQLLCAIASAFLGLVHAQLVLLDDEFDMSVIPISTNPAMTLDAYATRSDTECLDALTESAGYLSQPWPAWFGLGVQSVVTGDDDSGVVHSALTFGLWRIFARIDSYRLGYDLAELLDAAIGVIPEAIQECILGLKPLPADSNSEALFDHLVLPGVHYGGVRQLVAYAFAQTENLLADYTPYEAIEVFEHNELDWNDLLEVAETQKEAQAIAIAYSTWQRVIALDPLNELQKLEKAFHRAAKQAAKPRPPKTLMDIFTEYTNDNATEILATNPATTEARPIPA